MQNSGDSRSPLIMDPVDACRLLINENFSIAGSPLFRRQVIDNMGGYDESLKASEDYDFHYRMAMKSRIGILNKVGFYRRMHNSNMSTHTENILKSKIASRKKLLAVEKRSELRKELNCWLQEAHLNLGRYYIGKQYSNAFRCTMKSLRYGMPLGSYFYKNLIKCLFRLKADIRV